MREQRVQRRQVPGLKAAARRPQEFTESAAEHRREHRIAGTRRGQFDGRGGGGYGTEPGEREQHHKLGYGGGREGVRPSRRSCTSCAVRGALRSGDRGEEPR